MTLGVPISATEAVLRNVYVYVDAPVDVVPGDVLAFTVEAGANEAVLTHTAIAAGIADKGDIIFGAAQETKSSGQTTKVLIQGVGTVKFRDVSGSFGSAGTEAQVDETAAQKGYLIAATTGHRQVAIKGAAMSANTLVATEDTFFDGMSLSIK